MVLSRDAMHGSAFMRYFIYLFIYLIQSTFEDGPEVKNPHYVSKYYLREHCNFSLQTSKF